MKFYEFEALVAGRSAINCLSTVELRFLPKIHLPMKFLTTAPPLIIENRWRISNQVWLASE